MHYTTKIITVKVIQLITVAARSEAWVCCNLLGGIMGSNPGGEWISVSCECCILSSRCLCFGLITCPEGVLSSVLCLGVIVKPQ